jgi:ArsR family transcriptional regulator
LKSDQSKYPSSKEARQADLPESDLGDLCKALGHPVRVRLIKILLAKGECISGDLAEEFSLAQSTVSEHLRILKDAGLVKGTIDGPKRCYCVNTDKLSYFKSLMENL